MRRTATVTHCVPDAASACTIDSIDGYLPVPRNRRDVKRCLPSTSGLSVGMLMRTPHVATAQPARRDPASAAAEERHDLEPGAVPDRGGRLLGAAPQLLVAL